MTCSKQLNSVTDWGYAAKQFVKRLPDKVVVYYKKVNNIHMCYSFSCCTFSFNRTKSILVGLQGVVKKAVGLGGCHCRAYNNSFGWTLCSISVVSWAWKGWFATCNIC